MSAARRRVFGPGVAGLLTAMPGLVFGLVAGVAVALALAALPRPAAACDCGIGEPTPAEGLARLATVVEGRVIAMRSTAGGADVDLFVTRAWKGATAGAVVTLPFDGSSCGYWVMPGDDVLVYAPAGRPVEQCAGADTARVRSGAEAASDRAALGPPMSTAAAPATVTTAAADVVAEAVVRGVERGGRLRIEVSIARATRGARRKQALTVWSSTGACQIAAPAIGARVELRAVTVQGLAVVSACAPGTRLAPIRRPRP